MESAESTTQTDSPSSGPNLIAIEHKILDFWKKTNAFEKLQELCRTRKEFRFLDGPITANNPMGVHHAWGRSLKDLFIRYKCLRGFGSFFQNGFDCQGLWVEVEVEKELGFNGKPDIEKAGIDKFADACKRRIAKFSQVQTEQSIRLGQWMDWENSYFTHRDQNIEGIWQFLAKCHENGWLYQSGLPMPWCTRCGTSLSEHEMTGSYKDMQHQAVFIKLKVPKLNARIVVWTTTPWTLPANTALAVNPELDYIEVTVPGEDLPLIVGKDAVKALRAKVQVTRSLKGSELLGLEYEAIFPELPAQSTVKHKIVSWSDVDAKEGTGVVHMAPGCGREDYEVSKREPIDILRPADEEGNYVSGYGWLEGTNVHTIAPTIVEALKKSGKLYREYMHDHSYPICWRCKNELIFRLVDEWYISSKDIRPKLLEAAAAVHWQPEHVGKRMEDWLKNMGDWCISRKRFWGLPLPFYKCQSCDTLTVVKSKEELKRLSGDDLATVPELHRPWIDEIKINCPKCQAKASRVLDVGDCWLDAGIVPFSTRGYFESEKARAEWAPADWVCEMSEQVRLWFYSMLFMSTTFTGKAPYKRVLTYERVLSESGAKFSKTGYMIKFDEAAEKMGVDTMRYYFASQSPTSDIRFGYTRGDETRRQLIALWNVHSFFLTYAKIDHPDFSKLKDPAKLVNDMDRWLMARALEFLDEAERGYESYNTPQVTRAFEEYLEEVSNWYIRANRRRFWKSGDSDDKLIGYWCLYQALKTAVLVMAPIMPFMTEEIWQESIRCFDPSLPESIHHASWPNIHADWKNEKALTEARDVQRVINAAHRLRAEAQLKVRQPLLTLYISSNERLMASCGAMEPMLLNELNVKSVKYLSDRSGLFDKFLELDLKKAGPVLRGDVAKAVASVNALSGDALQRAVELVKGQKPVELNGVPIPVPAEIFILKDRARSNLAFVEEKDLFVALDTSVTPELEEEGWIRDILRQCQLQRKESGFDVTDRIQLGLKTESPRLEDAIKRYASLIENETLGKLSMGTVKQSPQDSAIDFEVGSVSVTMTKV